MFIPKIALISAVCFLQGTLTQESEPSIVVSNQQTSPARQYSILERTDKPHPTERSADVVTRVAQLPHSAEPLRTSLTQLPEPQQQSVAALPASQPIELQLTGADLFEVGQLQTFKIRIKNNTTTDFEPTEIRLGIPPGYRFQDSNIRAQFDSARNVAAWHLDAIKPRQEKTIHFRAVAIGQGPQLLQVSLNQRQRTQAINQLETFIVDSRSRGAGRSNQAAKTTLPPVVESEPLPHKTKNF